MNGLLSSNQKQPQGTRIDLYAIKVLGAFLFYLCSLLTLFLAILFVFRPAQAAFDANNRILAYQIRLTDTGGVAIPNGTKDIKISFYTVSTGGSPIHNDCDTTGTPIGRKVIFTSGIGTVLIGDTAADGSTNCTDGAAPEAIPASLFNNTTLYLGITVDPDVTEMTPRKRIASIGWAQNSDRLDDLEGSDLLRATATDTFEGGNANTLTIQSLLTGGARGTSLFSISQPNDVTNDATAALVDINQADTASSGIGMQIAQAGTGSALAVTSGKVGIGYSTTPTGLLGIGQPTQAVGGLFGVASAGNTLEISRTSTTTSANAVSIQNVWDLAAGGTASSALSVVHHSNSANTQNMTGTITGANFRSEHLGTGTAVTLNGLSAQADSLTGSGLVTNARAFNGNVDIAGGSVTNAYGIRGTIGTRSSGTITNGYGIYAANNTLTSGTITGSVGVGIEDITVGTNKTNLLIGTATIPTGNFSIYNPSAYNNYFLSNLGLNATSPIAKLHVAGAAAAAGTGTISSGGTTVTGSGTAFLTQLNIGDHIIASGQTRTVATITSNTSLTTGAAASDAFSPAITAGTSYTFQQPIARFADSGNVTQDIINPIGNIGIGTTTALSQLSISSATAVDDGIEITNTGTGDPRIQFKISTVPAYTMGVDNSDGDSFKIERSATLGGGSPAFTINFSSSSTTFGTSISASAGISGTSLTATTGNITSTLGVFRGSSGTAAAPTYSFTGATTTGTFLSLGGLGFSVGGTERMRIAADGTLGIGASALGSSLGGGVFIAPAASTSGTPNMLRITVPAHTGLTASTEANDYLFGNSLKTFATGALATQRSMLINAPSYAFAGASALTNASTVSIVGPPRGGTNATITNTYALRIETGNAALTTTPVNAFGLFVDAPTGATNNYGAVINTGNVGIGDASPASLLTVGNGDLFQVNSSGDLVRIDNVTYDWPGANASGVLTNNGAGLLSWTAAAGGDITAVGSMLSGAVFADATADDDWLGLGASAGRIEFDDQTIDEVNILDANVGIGTTSPNNLLTVDSDGTAAVPTIAFDSSDSNTGFFHPAVDVLAFSTNGTEAARFNSTQQFVIGTTGAVPAGFGMVQYGVQGAQTLMRKAGGSGDYPHILMDNSQGTLASPTASLSNDTLGLLLYAGHTGVTYGQAAQIVASADAAFSAGSAPGRLSFWTTSTGSAVSVERMRIDNAGNVGIGMSPTHRLTVADSVGADSIPGSLRLQMSNSVAVGGNGLGFGTDYYIENSNGNLNGVAQINVALDDATEGSEDSSFRFTTRAAGGAPTERVRFASTGNVGIGSTAPEGLLEVQGAEATDAAFYLDADDGDDNADTWILKSQAADNDFTFTNHTSELVRITDSGNVGIGTTTPNQALTLGDGLHQIINAGSLTTAFGGFGRHENFVTRSQDFNFGNWTKESTIAFTGDSGDAAAPDGTVTADKITTGGAVATDGTTQAAFGAPDPSNTTWTGSVWMRLSTGGPTIVNLRISTGSTTGTASAASVTSTGWQRFTVTQPFGAAQTGTATFRIESGTATNILLWGGQLERQTNAGVYVRTDNTALTTTRYGSAAPMISGGEAGVFQVTNTGDISFFGDGATRTISATTTTLANTAGSSINMTAGSGNGSGAGGNVVVLGGTGGATGVGGGVSLVTGQGASTFSSGDLNLLTSASTQANSGAINVTTGNALTSGNSGAITIINGTAAGGTPGNINLGTSNTTLTVIGNDATGNTAIKLDVDGLMRVNLRTATGANGPFALCHETDGTQDNEEIKDCNGAPTADYAEQYPVVQGTEYGDIMVASETLVTTTQGDKVPQLVKSSATHQFALVGVVSDNHSDFTSAGYNINDADNPMPIALNGRVLVKVSAENGAIKIGDAITTSLTPGVGMKAMQNGMIVGFALNAHESGTGKIMVFINTGWWNGATVSQGNSSSGASNLSALSNDLDLHGHALLNVRSISSLGGNWSIDEAGLLKIKVIEAEKVTARAYGVEVTDDSRTLGHASIPAGSATIEVINPAVHPTSEIMLTFKRDTRGSWWVEETREGSFTLKISVAAIEEIPFTYWVIDVTDHSTPPAPPTPPAVIFEAVATP